MYCFYGTIVLRNIPQILLHIVGGYMWCITFIFCFLHLILGSLDSAHAAALQAHVAKLVTSPPAGADKAPYLMNIGTQALDLVLYGLFKNDKVSVLWNIMYNCAVGILLERLHYAGLRMCDLF